VLGTTDVEVSGLVLQRALVLDAQLDGAGAPGSTWQVVARHAADAPAAGAPVELALYQATRLDDAVPCQWQQVASAHAQPTAAASTADERGDDGPVEADIAAVYQSFLDAGADFGPVFRSIHRLKYEAACATVWLQRPDADGGDGLASSVHPAVLDGALQAALVAAGAGTLRALMLPFAVDRFVVHAPVPGALTAHVRWAAAPGDTAALTVDADFHAHDGTLVARLEGVRCVRPRAETLSVPTAGGDPWLHEVVWRTETDAPATAADASGAWMLLCDGAGTGDALAAALRAEGQPCLCVVAGERLQRSGPDRATVDPLRAEHLEALLSDPAWRAGQRLSGVVHLWSLDLAGRPPDDETLADLQGRCEAEDRRAAISALALVQAAARAASAAGVDTQVVFVTAGAQPGGTPVARVAAAGLWGLANAVAAEHPELAVRAIDLDLDAVDVSALAAELRRGRTAAPRLLNRGARRLVPMLHRRPPAAGERSVQLAPGPSSTLEDLRWIPCAPPPPGPGEVRVRVAATGLNFRDVLLALGMIPREEAFFGAECAGVVEAVGAGVDDLEPGDAVFGFAPHSLATVLNVPAAFLSRWPHELGSMELAASLPVAYLTALLGFDRHARLKAGDLVLIHAAAGGVGLAAVRLAQRAGAEVFATAGSPAKRALLASLGVAHVFDSRTLEFASQVRASTGGAGVDVVLNSLAGAFIGASVEALAPQGCFLELGKRDVWSAERFHAVRPQARYCVYDLGRSAEAEPGIVRPMLHQVLAGLREGRLAPLPLRAFEFSDVGDAMRLMAQARHTGKLVLRAPSIASSQPLVRQDASYWITGGLGALGLHTARWLAGHGARHLVLTSRGAPGQAAAEVVRDLEAQGISVLVRQADAGDAGQMRAVFDDIARNLPPLRGVVHAAGALDDGVLLQQDDQRFAGVMRGKSQGARILDALTRPVALDFFIMYSAAGLLLGPAGQGSYAAANAQLDALAHARRAAGLPALSVAWGLWLEGGMATTSASAGQNPWVARGLGWIEPAEAFARLERLLREGAVQTAVLPIDWTRFLARVPSGVDTRFFEPLVGERRAASTGAAQPGASPQVRLGRADVWRNLPESQRRSAVQDHVTEQALQVLGLPATTELDTHAPLKDAGLDSLMAVELRNALARSLGHALPATLLFDHPSLEALSTHVLRTLRLVEPEPAVTRHDVEASSQARSDVAELTDAEAEAQLLAELENTTPRRRP
jgi:NADPH:quinone reductase-like Zn-dependent oxidoreductase/acyl carrier protein